MSLRTQYTCVRCAKPMSEYGEIVEHQAACTSPIKVCQKCHQPMKEVLLFTGYVYDCSNCARATVNKDATLEAWPIPYEQWPFPYLGPCIESDPLRCACLKCFEIRRKSFLAASGIEEEIG